MYYVPDGQLDPDRIFQGDIFVDFPCFFLPSTDFQFLREDGQVCAEVDLPQGWREEELLIVRARRYKIILLSQTCDIHEEGKRNLYLDANENYANQLILYAPIIPLTELEKYKKQRDATKDRRQLENQKISSAFFLPAHPDGQRVPDSIVYFPWVCSIAKSKANRFSTFEPKNRLTSLASPFREAFASKFGQAIERVALPTGDFADLFDNNARAVMH